MPFAVLAIVGLDEELVGALVERDGDPDGVEFVGMVEHGHLPAIQVNDRPVVQAETERDAALGSTGQGART